MLHQLKLQKSIVLRKPTAAIDIQDSELSGSNIYCIVKQNILNRLATWQMSSLKAKNGKIGYSLTLVYGQRLYSPSYQIFLETQGELLSCYR